jgi:hypothetical protein
MVNPKEPYHIHWPIRRGCFNIHSGPGGTISAVLQDLEDILSTALQTYLNIPRTDIKVSVKLFIDFCINQYGFSGLLAFTL